MLTRAKPMQTLADLLGAAPSPDQPAKPVPAHSVRALARDLLQSADYRQTLFDRLKLGTLAPAIELAIWHYAYGKPVDHVKIEEVNKPLESLSDEQLETHLRKLSDLVRRIREVQPIYPDSGESVH